MWTSFDWHMVV